MMDLYHLIINSFHFSLHCTYSWVVGGLNLSVLRCICACALNGLKRALTGHCACSSHRPIHVLCASGTTRDNKDKNAPIQV